MHGLKAVAVGDIRFSKTNPRAGINQERLNELAESIRNVGVLEPILIRPLESKNGTSYELVCGERRLRAAQLAQLAEIPAIVRDLTDEQALEVQVIENLQREDLHPLDEAEGYRQLMAKGKYDVARLAARIGRSVKYVYDRVKLLALTPDAKKAFLEERITAGHAILLARLKPSAQERALDDRHGGVFEHEDTLFDPMDRNAFPARGSMKPRSVRELAGWIDEHVRFDVKARDLPDLFPETAQAIAVAEEGERKIIPITHAHYVQQDARDKERIVGPRSWKRADGADWHDPALHKKVKSKKCDRSGLGVILAGPGRGDSFEVCVSRSCEVHWPQQAKKAKERAASGRPAASNAPISARRVDQEMETALREARDKARAEIASAVLAVAATMKPLDLMRVVVLHRWELRDYLRKVSKGESDNAQKAWVRGAAIADLQKALVFAELENSPNADFTAAFGVKADAVFESHEKMAREALAAARAEKKAASPRAPAKGTKKAAAKKKRAAK